MQEAEEEAVDRLKQRYKKEDASKIFANLIFLFLTIRSIMRSMFLGKILFVFHSLVIVLKCFFRETKSTN